MPPSFDERVEQFWAASDWMIDDMFNGGMCFFEGYVPAIDLDLLDTVLPQLAGASIDFRCSTWSNDTNGSDWNRVYQLSEYVTFFRAGKILSLHADYTVAQAGFDFTLKLMFEPEGNLEIIFYRENLLPRTETRARFKAACHYLCHLKSVFHGAALFAGPDTLDYPQWPGSIPKEWFQLE